MSRKASQCQKILDFINDFGGITPAQAMGHFGCMRLAARIADLEKAGHTFTRSWITVKTEDGTVRFMRYGRA